MTPERAHELAVTLRTIIAHRYHSPGGHAGGDYATGNDLKEVGGFGGGVAAASAQVNRAAE